jgi:hypothetical protein
MTIPPATSLGFGLNDSDGNGEQDSSVAVRSVVTVDVYTVLANPAIQKCVNSASHSFVKLFYPIGVTSSTSGPQVAGHVQKVFACPRGKVIQICGTGGMISLAHYPYTGAEGLSTEGPPEASSARRIDIKNCA